MASLPGDILDVSHTSIYLQCVYLHIYVYILHICKDASRNPRKPIRHAAVPGIWPRFFPINVRTNNLSPSSFCFSILVIVIVLMSNWRKNYKSAWVFSLLSLQYSFPWPHHGPLLADFKTDVLHDHPHRLFVYFPAPFPLPRRPLLLL